MDKLVAHGEYRARRMYEIEEELAKIDASMSKLNAELANQTAEPARAECKLWIAGLASLSQKLQEEAESL